MKAKEGIHETEDTLYPEKYPFIVTRREAFGGYLFNRFLSYTQLDVLQMRILDFCEGHFTLREIVDHLTNEFQMAGQIIEKQVHEAFDLFAGYHAINWRKIPKSKVFGIPESPQLDNFGDSRFLSSPLYVLWDITYSCNLHCEHCLTDSGNNRVEPMSLEEVKGVIDQLVDMNVFFVNFLGGEPLLRPDMIDILEYASKYPIGIGISTNGILVNDGLLKRLHDLNVFDIQVSVDGLEESHDLFRGMSGAYKKATSAVQQFSNAGFKTTVNTVMTKKNKDELKELIDVAVSLGASTFKAVAFLPVGRGKQSYDKLGLSASELNETIIQLRQLQELYGEKITIVTEENYPLQMGEERVEHSANSFPNIGCAAGISQLVIDPTGNVFACPFLHDFVAGNLRNKSLRDIWTHSEVFQSFRRFSQKNLNGACGSCEYIGTRCRGGCRASAYALSGDLWAEDPLCWYIGSKPKT